MYDPVTERLIREIPELAGLDRANLPNFLTSVYARLVTARLEYTTGANASSLLTADLDRLARIAAALEMMACLAAPGDPSRRSSAFVAATAHDLLHRVRSQTAPDPIPGLLAANAISPAISAMLLFQVAGAFADAHAVAVQLRPPDGRGAAAVLARQLAHLGTGRLVEIAAAESISTPTDGDLDDVLLHWLWLTLDTGVRALAHSLLGSTPANDHVTYFRQVRELSAKDVSSEDWVPSAGPADVRYLQVLGGPHHLAVLLIAAADALQSAAVTRVPPPTGTDPDYWQGFTRTLAPRRPLLWQNHLDALAKGMLDRGVSAAISFPTGAGKSTLVQLKIGVALERGGKVVLLVPTHALADQSIRDLASTFPKASVERPSAAWTAADEAGHILVTTPEACLAATGGRPDDFRDVDLIVFDECHLLHPARRFEDRRSLDSMLCLLRLLDLAPTADVVLLSAMMSNPDELAGWLSDLHSRRCLPLNLEWKPTRQARGCLVYLSDEIRNLQGLIREAKAKAQTKHPPARLRKALLATPHTLFCLRSAWTNESEDYALVPALGSPLLLHATRSPYDGTWALTANRNEVSAEVAAGLALGGIRTMVLVQDVRHVGTVAAGIASHLASRRGDIARPVAEADALDQAIEEAGGAAHALLPVDGLVGLHHGLLLAAERRLNEELFQRTGGIPALVASPTLAMGINLPAEAVVITGDDRFDPVLNRMVPLAAHELLNAAGRAGRAGSCSQGIVVVVPGKVVAVDWANGQVSSHWADLLNVFSNSDQCLRITDPLEVWLDGVQAAAGDPESIARTRYFVARLPAASRDDDSSTRQLLNRSLAAYQASRDHKEREHAIRVDGACIARQALEGTFPQSQLEVASSTGVDPVLVGHVESAVQGPRPRYDASVAEWLAWWFAWLAGHLEVARSIHRSSEKSKDLAALFDSSEGVHTLGRLTRAWIDGGTLRDLELLWGTVEDKLGPCWNAREFVLRMVPEVSFGASLLARVYEKAIAADTGERALGLELLGMCVREGLASPEETILHSKLPISRRSRLRTKSLTRELGPLLPPPVMGEDQSGVRARVLVALRQLTRSRRAGA